MGPVSSRRARRRPTLVSGLVAGLAAAGLVALLTAILASCSGGGDDDHRPASTASRASEAKATTMVTTIGDVSGGPLGDARRQATKKQVEAVVEDFLDGAYLGTFPRADYSAAFADFTPQAATLADQQLDVLSNQGISAQITSATATHRRLRLTVFAPHGRPRGITARFVLDFTTKGDLKEDQRVLGELYLTKPLGSSWQVFGFRVDQAVTS